MGLRRPERTGSDPSGAGARAAAGAAETNGAGFRGAVDIHKGVLLECYGLVGLLAGAGRHGRLSDHLDLGPVPVLSDFFRHVHTPPAES